jgi:GT2 family glycosyltransferase
VDVSIVIPSWNGRRLLEKFLPSVIAAARRYREEGGGAVELLIVDDGSTDDTALWLARAHSGEAELLIKRRNEGFAHACNTGFAHARHPAILLLNNDVEVARDAIAPAVRHLSEPDVFAVACLTTDLASGRATGVGKLGSFARGFLRVHAGYMPTRDGARDLIAIFASGGAAAFSSEKLAALGGFDPLYSPFYWEDVELSYRAWKRGWRVLFEPQSRVRHQVSSTIGNRFAPGAVRAVQHRNRLLAHWVHMHDARMWRSHLAQVALLAATAPLRADLAFLIGLGQALRLRGQACERRTRERAAAVRTDGEIMELFRNFARRADIERIIDDRIRG